LSSTSLSLENQIFYGSGRYYEVELGKWSRQDEYLQTSRGYDAPDEPGIRYNTIKSCAGTYLVCTPIFFANGLPWLERSISLGSRKYILGQTSVFAFFVLTINLFEACIFLCQQSCLRIIMSTGFECSIPCTMLRSRSGNVDFDYTEEQMRWKIELILR